MTFGVGSQLSKMSATNLCRGLLARSGRLRTCSVAARSVSSKPSDIETHTGQKWDKEDYRMVRFINSPKQVNSQWAIKLIDEVPPKKTNKRVVWCDGGSGAEGHPRVFINLDKPGNHACGYCGLRFVKEDHH